MRHGDEQVSVLIYLALLKSNGHSLRKDRRSTHVHACRHKERAPKLERSPAELKYCYLCFSWVVEEDWNKHCQCHLKSFISRRCGSFTYCNTLIRPGFCPFCIGNDRLDASSRLGSWTREPQLRSHLEVHLKGASWPRKCPFPLCNLEFADKRLFLYHLSDVHSLKAGPRKDTGLQEESGKDQFVTWDPDTTLGKRKRKDSDLAKIQTVSPHMLSKFPILDDAFSDLPELTHSGPATPPDIEQPCTDEFKDTSEIDTNKGRISLADDDALFSLYLRSRSPSCLSGKGEMEETAALETLSSNKVGVPKVAEFDCIRSIEQDVIEPPKTLPKVKKPRIILQVRPPETKAKPKIILRLKQPQKQSQKYPAKKSNSKSQLIPKIKLRLRKPIQSI